MIKKWLKKLPIPITKNHRYDLQAKKTLKKVLKNNSCCIDVGCHEGEFLDLFLKYAPQGKHLGFEPLPDYFLNLKKNYQPTCQVFNVALSNKKGKSSFNYVISNPAYSGLQKRNYDKPSEKDTTITVVTDLLDEFVDQKVDFIKIDVEGGEYQVLQGAANTIKKYHPTIIFEHGLGAADVYGTTPEMMFDLLVSDYGMKISTMKRYLNGAIPFSKETFAQHFYKNWDYYFIAYH
jgi:FkbM family methyltransferase